MRTLLDTNCAARTAHAVDPQHDEIEAAVLTLVTAGVRPNIVPQTAYEFWVIATRPVANNGFGWTPAETAAQLTQLKLRFTLLHDTPDVFHEWERLVVQHGVTGKPAHDARFVAAMQVHGVGRIVTYNVADFRRYPHVVAVSPADIVAGRVPP